MNQTQQSLLKFITCGSVDDGKSTLIGHMLYDAKLIFADQENALKLDSKLGSSDGEMDYALLLDGLSAEREQGITIDVAYRYFNTERRSFIVADTPGHEEYTRNMAVGASFADLAVILLDASKGILLQTRRHARICALMGIRHFVFAINKMDLIGYHAVKFYDLQQEIYALMKEIGYDSIYCIPVSAKVGDNVSKDSLAMPWFQGKNLLDYLETVDISVQEEDKPFLMTVQRVCRPNHSFRGFQGEVVEGKISLGDAVTVYPSGQQAKVEKLLATNREVSQIYGGQPATICLDREVDCSRGCVLSQMSQSTTSRLFHGELLWMEEEPLLVGRNYLLKLGTKIVPATVLKISHCVDVNTGQHLPAKEGKKNDIIACDISLSEKIVFAPFDQCKELGRFLLINRVSNATAGCGLIRHTLNRSDNLTFQNLEITGEMRGRQKGQVARTIWFTGLSGSGKSTLANALEKELFAQGKHTMLLDGDNIRMGLNNNLGFTKEDRIENIRRIAETCKLMNDAGLIVLVSVISPFAGDRQNAREIIGEAFFEVFVDTSLEACEKRDTKGLYKKARSGQLKNFTGISSPYEAPERAEFVARTEEESLETLVKGILGEM